MRARVRWAVASAIAAGAILTACDPPSEQVPERAASSRTKKKKKGKKKKPQDDLDTKAIVSWLQAAKRADLVERDHDAYMKIWAKDARAVVGRTGEPDAYDLVLDYRALEETSRVRKRGKPDAEKSLRFDDERVVTGEDGKLTVTWSECLSWKRLGREGELCGTNRFHLRQSNEGLRVYAARHWLTEDRGAEGVTKLDAKHFAQRDDEVERLRANGVSIQLLSALEDAQHLLEAHGVAVMLTLQEPHNEGAWAARGRLSAALALFDDAAVSYWRLFSIDTHAFVPGWVLASPVPALAKTSPKARCKAVATKLRDLRAIEAARHDVPEDKALTREVTKRFLEHCENSPLSDEAYRCLIQSETGADVRACMK